MAADDPFPGSIRRRVVVTGRVQGVYFRDSCREQAELHGVSGFVRNRPDGSVEAAFEGPPSSVAAMISWCHSGPPRAFVESVVSEDEAPVGERRFAVRG